MTLIVAWLLFPALLALLALGWGLLLEEAGRIRLPGALLLPVGTAAIIVVAQLVTAADATAELAVPLVVTIAAAGIVISPPWRRAPIEVWTAAASVAVFFLYGAPILLSGEPTFAGFIKLDDTATWLAMTDRVMESGRSLTGLAPSSYEAALANYLPLGSPLGAMLPLGVGHGVISTDSAWLIQPCMSFYAAMLALALSEVARPLVTGARARAAVAFVAAQPALLFAYVMWGGIKEIAAAFLLALTAATAPLAYTAATPAAVIPLGLACGALLAAVGPAGGVWLAPLLVGFLMLALARLGPHVTTRRAIGLATVIGLSSVPLLTGHGFTAATTSALYAESELGNLIEPLSGFQVVGIWPVGDFRLAPDDGVATALIIGLALLAVVASLAAAARAKVAALPLYLLGSLAGTGVILVAGSPWVDAKALATVSPAVLVAALAGAGAVDATGRHIAGMVVGGLIAFGVLWSNALAYREVNLAPFDQLSELEDIGERIAGQGPTLMTDFQPYGVRHFLREADPEGVSELRRRVIPLRGGGQVETGREADTDELQLEGLLVYRTLVLRRSPEQSRPPSPYQLQERGEFYEVWQRPLVPPPSGLRHHSLGSGIQPTAEMPCNELRRFASTVGAGGQIAYAERPPNVVYELPAASAGTATVRVQLPAAGIWRIWLGGSVRGNLDLLIDGRKIGSARHRINYGFYMDLGELTLAPGSHLVEVRADGPDLHPGSAGPEGPLGPLVFSNAEAADETVRFLPASRASSLCGRRLDWIEVLPG